MHPDHVAALVAEQVDALRTSLQQLDLPVSDVELRGQSEVLIRFTSRTTEAVAGISGIPGVTAVPLIGSLREDKFFLHLDCTNFDFRAPAIDLLESEEKSLPPERWPHDPKERGIVQGHPDFPGRKFFCRPGTREFHSHPQHEDEPWDAVREWMTIDKIALGILHDLKERWTIR